MFAVDLDKAPASLYDETTGKTTTYTKEHIKPRNSKEDSNDYDLYKFINEPRGKNEKDKLKELHLGSWSIFFELKIFRISFWKRFANCYLHLCLEGNWKRHLCYLATKYKKDGIAIGKSTIIY